MLYWKCENKDCEQFGKEIIEVKPMFKYTSNGTVPIDIPYCKCCGKQMGYREELPESDGEINVAFASFNSMSNEDKSTMLKKRYKEGIKKDIDEKIRVKREQVTKSFFGQ
jgi:hypothetical protein